MYRKIVFALLFMPLWAWGAVPTAVNDTTPEALYSLGIDYLNGNDSLGIYMNKEKGVELLRRAAEQGNADAQYNLGDCYYYGEGVAQDYAQAVYWWRQAAEQGDAMVQNKLGICYCNGQGVAQDYAQAVYWWRQAAEQGNAYAQYHLGVCYAKGLGVERDSEQAEYWKNLAIQNGYIPD